MKLNLLDKLIERVYDKHAHSRSCVLGVLSDLCQENVIPMETLGSLLKIAADRVILITLNLITVYLSYIINKKQI
jgi:hypothetical protein